MRVSSQRLNRLRGALEQQWSYRDFEVRLSAMTDEEFRKHYEQVLRNLTDAQLRHVTPEERAAALMLRNGGRLTFLKAAQSGADELP